MPRGATTFRQRDITAAIKAAIAAGCEVVRIEVDKGGTIVVITSNSADARGASSIDPKDNEWDRV